jgi:hypothetical protein
MDQNNIINIWQQNVNKSPTSQHNLISCGKLLDLDINIIVLQEPAINVFNQLITTRNWIMVYPSTHISNLGNTHSTIPICADMSTDTWNQIDFPSGDVTIIQLTGMWGKLNILNIYNNSKSNITVTC